MTEDKNYWLGFFIGIGCAWLGIAIGGIFGSSENEELKQQAIEGGHAHYVVDSQGNVEFEWLDCNLNNKNNE